MDHDSIVQDWQKHAEQNDEKNYRFLRSLKHRDYGFEPDEVAGELHEQAFKMVDCNRCANCCKTMTVLLTEADIERIAQHLNMPVQEFHRAAYLEPDESQSSSAQDAAATLPVPRRRRPLHHLRRAARRLPGISAHRQGRLQLFRTMLHANNAGSNVPPSSGSSNNMRPPGKTVTGR